MKIIKTSRLLLASIFMLFTVHAFSQTKIPADDTAINAKVKSAITANQSVSGLNVVVMTDKGIVTISGNVDSDSQASTLVEIAQSIPGVKDVDASKLIVNISKQPFADMLITSKIKGLYIQEKLFGEKDISAMSIHVETKDGDVYLTGTADNQKQADNVISIAKSVSGVKSVKSDIKITKTQTISAH